MPEEPLTRCEFNANDLILRLDVSLPADIEQMEPLVMQVMEAVGELGCAVGKEFEIRLALEEALANAIIHGSQGDPDKDIQCSVACDEKRGMLIVVRDTGPGFDPASVPSPVIGENIYAESGRGIYLINQLTDEVRFERGGTEIHMRID